MSQLSFAGTQCLLLLSFMNGFAWADATPEGAVSSERVQAAVQKLDDLATETLKTTGVPGIAIAVVHDDRVVFLKGYGVREAGRPEPIDADTVFQVASVSKPITSTVLAALVGAGRVDWDDRIVDHDPGFRLSDVWVTHEVRLRDMLCHRSGLPDHGGDLAEDLGFGRDEVLRRLRFLPLTGDFRATYAYTNFGYSEAAYAAAKACSQDWEDLAAQTLFQPLGMTSTSYRFSDYERSTNRARLHVPVDGRWTAKFTRQPDAQSPAGGVSTNLNDIVHWMRLHLNEGEFEGKRVVDAAALAETHRPQMVVQFSPEDGRVFSYGLGWNVSVERGGRVFSKHSGAFALGMRTEVALLPSENLGIAVFSNAAPTGIPEGLTESFFDFVLNGELQRNWVEFANRMFELDTQRDLDREPDYGPPPADGQPALALSAYEGKYANEFFGTIEVVDREGRLWLRLGPQPFEAELRHFNRDLFLYDPIGENAGRPSAVRFSIDARRRADSVLIQNLNVDGQGRFTRAE